MCVVRETIRPRLINYRWHQDLKPANVLRVASQSQHAFKGSIFKIADLGLCQFKTYTGEDGERKTLARKGTETYGAPECYKATASTERQSTYIDQRADVWSLGAIFSENANWVCYGPPGVKLYREDRISAHPKSFRVPDCFHDGTDALPIVKTMHDELKENLRPADSITKLVVDLVREMLFSHFGQRPTAEQLVGRAEMIIEDAKKTGVPTVRRKDTKLDEDSQSRDENENKYTPGGSSDAPQSPGSNATPSDQDAISQSPNQTVAMPPLITQPRSSHLSARRPTPQKWPIDEALAWFKKSKEAQQKSPFAKMQPMEPHHEQLFKQLEGRDHVRYPFPTGLRQRS